MAGKRMKHSRIRRRITAAMLVCVMLLSLTACGDGLVRLEYEDDRFVNRSAGLSYIAAPVSYEPTVVGEAYAYYKAADMTLYTLGNADPTLWLTTENMGELTTVFHSDTITLPTLAEFGANAIHVCQSDYYTFEVLCIDDTAVVESVVTQFENGAEAVLPEGASLLHYDMKFASPEWPEIYINLNYYEFESGNYLYSRNTQRCVEIGDLLEDILHGGES